MLERCWSVARFGGNTVREKVRIERLACERALTDGQGVATLAAVSFVDLASAGGVGRDLCAGTGAGTEDAK
ncbi:hypothetical protein WCLP8_4800007 [uncultured Gammaproteobacteria bacterium]